MSELATALRLLITGDSASAVRAVNEVGSATAKVDGETKARNDKMLAAQQAGVTKARAGLGIMAGGLGLVAGAGALAIGQYKTFAEAVVNMQKVTGLSAQSASRLVGEWQTMGINVAGTTRIVGFFSKAYEAATVGTLAQTTKAKDGIAKVNSEIAALGTSVGTAAGQKKLAAYQLQLQQYQAVLDPATQKTNAQAQAFKELGLSTGQLTAMGSDKALTTIRDRLAEMGDKAQRLTIIKTIFGRGATDPAFLRWVTTSADEMGKLDASLKSAGMIWNQQQVDQAAQLGEKVRGIQEALRATAISIGSTMVPALSKMATVAMAVSGWIAKQPGWLKDIVAFTPGVLLLAIGFGKVYSGISQSIKAGQGLFNVMKSLVGKFTPGGSASGGAGGTTANTQAEQRNTLATNENTAASRKATLATDAATTAEKKNVLATDLSTGADKKNAIASELSGTKLGGLAGKAESAAGDVEGMGGKAAKAEGGIMGMSGASVKSAATLGALAFAAAFTMNQLSKLGNAIDSMNSAIGQEKKQAADVGTNAQHDLAMIAKKYGKNSRQYREELGIVQSDLKAAGQDAYSEPWWAKAASGVKGGIGSAWNALFGGSQAAGGSYDVTKPTIFLAGENGPEHAIFIPHGKAGELARSYGRGGGGAGGTSTKLELHLHGGTFIGTTNAHVGADLMKILQPLLAQRDARFVQQGAF